MVYWHVNLQSHYLRTTLFTNVLISVHVQENKIITRQWVSASMSSNEMYNDIMNELHNMFCAKPYICRVLCNVR